MKRKRMGGGPCGRSRMNGLMRRFDERCWWCKCRVVRVPSGHLGALNWNHATRDHLVTWSSGGAAGNHNLVLSCHACNNDRGKLKFGAWTQRLRERGLDHDWHNLPPIEWSIPHPNPPPRIFPNNAEPCND